MPPRSGEKHYLWKGEKVGYSALHRWIRKQIPDLKICKKCNKIGKTQVANISGLYKRNLSDWERMCHSCHSKFDRQGDKFNGIRPKRCLTCGRYGCKKPKNHKVYFSKSFKEKMSKRFKGVPKSEEHRLKISKARKAYYAALRITKELNLHD